MVLQDQVPPELTRALGALAGPAWLIALATAVKIGASIIQVVKHPAPAHNGNGKGLSLADINRVTDKMDEGFQRLTDQMARSETTLRSDMKSLSAYTIAAQLSLDKLLERETKE